MTCENQNPKRNRAGQEIFQRTECFRFGGEPKARNTPADRGTSGQEQFRHRILWEKQMSVSGPQTGKPAIEGTYVAEVYHGWRVLEWCAGRWCYDGGWAHWQAGEPVQWIGPLPERIGGATPPPILGQDPKMEYDL